MTISISGPSGKETVSDNTPDTKGKATQIFTETGNKTKHSGTKARVNKRAPQNTCGM